MRTLLALGFIGACTAALPAFIQHKSLAGGLFCMAVALAFLVPSLRHSLKAE
ncbi:hypothetical protein [Variovorax paradoxus]|uniref:Uncharacterized protein n=1 Tax=Variovorax paradoxus TaxID=34073 RepID=A0A679JFP4_VARPD|nr:hypothetical protein VVAX_04363 [Variovorax paradoxus]